MSSVTPELAAAIDEALSQIPPSHQIKPVHNEVFTSREEGYVRLQDWAFTQHFAFVIEHSNAKRTDYECVHHKDETKNWRKNNKETAERSQTNEQAKGCNIRCYISFRKLGKSKDEEKQWLFGWSKGSEEASHGHRMNPDPFSYIQHKAKIPGRALSHSVAETHRGLLTYSLSNAVLANSGGYQLSKKEFYNLTTKAQQNPGTLTKNQELQLIYEHMSQEGFHIRVDSFYTVNEVTGERMSTEIRGMVITNTELIRMARRFVSRFMYETDDTFSTNNRRLPLSILVGINNLGQTFPFMFDFHLSESLESFDHVRDCQGELIFPDNVPWYNGMLADFAGGMTASHNAYKVREMAAAAREGREPRLSFLQYCEWHMVSAMKKKVIKDGGYSTERREEITNLLWQYVKAPTVDELTAVRTKLIAKLHRKQAGVIEQYYQHKEPQFVRAYTHKLANLGSNSTQRSEGYHPVIKNLMHGQMQLAKCVQRLRQHIVTMGAMYDRQINDERRTRPQNIDKVAFAVVLQDLYTHYALNMAAGEWEETKLLADEIQEELQTEMGEEIWEEDALDDFSCPFECSLPLRYGLPCRHWMIFAFRAAIPLPSSLFDPRWLFDHDPADQGEWQMSWKPDDDDRNSLGVVHDLNFHLANRSIGDIYHDRGRALQMRSIMQMIEKQKSLPAHEAEKFAAQSAKLMDKIIAKQTRIKEAQELHPPQLPDPLPKTGIHPHSRKAGARGMTGEELATHTQKTTATQKKRSAKEAQLKEKERVDDEEKEEESRKKQKTVPQIDLTDSMTAEEQAELDAQITEALKDCQYISSGDDEEEEQNEEQDKEDDEEEQDEEQDEDDDEDPFRPLSPPHSTAARSKVPTSTASSKAHPSTAASSRSTRAKKPSLTAKERLEKESREVTRMAMQLTKKRLQLKKNQSMYQEELQDLEFEDDEVDNSQFHSG